MDLIQEIDNANTGPLMDGPWVSYWMMPLILVIHISPAK
jgi:hypothetical protein